MNTMDYDHDHSPSDKLLLRVVGLLEQLINITISGDQAIINAIGSPQPVVPTAGKISQVIGGKAMSVTGTIPGTTSTFEVDALLNGIQDPAGWPAGTVDTWTTDDPNAVVGPASGPDVNQPGALDQVTVSLPVTDTQGSAPAGSPPSYNLTASVQMPAVNGVTPAPIVVTVNVPIQAAPVPVPTGAAINQIN